MRRPGVLKCPFCGRNPGLRIGYGGDAPAITCEHGDDVVYLTCLHCGADGPAAKVRLKAKEQTKLMAAVRAWNVRAE